MGHSRNAGALLAHLGWVHLAYPRRPVPMMLPVTMWRTRPPTYWWAASGSSYGLLA